MNTSIKIGKPYIVDDGDVTRMEALISGGKINKIHYFEVQKEYGKYFCYEYSDAFVVSLLYFALVNGYDIECEAPMSEKLYYQLMNVLIPMMFRYRPEKFHNIRISAILDNKGVSNSGGVGTAVSGGVDSFYTIVSNLNNYAKDYKLTHLLVANSFNIFRGDEDTRRRFKEIADNSQLIADELGLPLIRIYSNHSEFWFKNYQNIFALKYASYPMALQKLFSVYYFSSGYEYSDFSVTSRDLDSSHYDAISVPNASTETFSFILFGGEATRSQKIRRIMDNPVVQKRIQVCNIHIQNCSVCEKCMRTQMTLYAYNKLNNFSEAFDLRKFETQKNKTLIRMISVRAPFDIDNLNIMKQNGVIIPVRIRVIGRILRIFYKLKQIAKKIPIIYKLAIIVRKNKYDYDIREIEEYNNDKDFAKKCDPGIV